MDPFLSSPLAPEVYVKTIPSKGKGIFANDFISAGKRVVQESATFWAEDPTPFGICLLIRGLSSNDREKYRIMLSHLPDQPHKLAVYREQLSEPGMESVEARHLDAVARSVALFWNNSFTLRKAKDGADRVPGMQGIFLRAARLKHSCKPNCHASYNRAIGKLCVHAIRNIQPYEELLIMYLPDELLFQERSVRMSKLQEAFGFKCNCTACDISTTSGANLEPKRVLIANLWKSIQTYTATSAGPSIESLHKDLLKLMGEVGSNTWEKGEL